MLIFDTIKFVVHEISDPSCRIPFRYEIRDVNTDALIRQFRYKYRAIGWAILNSK